MPTAVQAAQEAAKGTASYELVSTEPQSGFSSSSTPCKLLHNLPHRWGTGVIPDMGKIYQPGIFTREDDPPTSVDTGPSEAEIIRQMIEDAKKARNSFNACVFRQDV